ncbi:MAG: DUF1631 family protein [Lautropia sp.]|nr:DUF1631 family protein [Lautropia sp.]
MTHIIQGLALSSRIDSSLYPRLHEFVADQFSTVVLKLLPEIADALLSHATNGLKPSLTVKLTETARLLREEAAVRAEIALEHFVRLQLDSVGDETLIAAASADDGRRPLPMSDAALLEQILARELASSIRADFHGTYPHYLRRLEALTGDSLRDDEHPLGARALSLALIFALKPFSHTQPISLHLRPIILATAAEPLARLIAATDQKLIQAGVLAEEPAVSRKPPRYKASVMGGAQRSSAGKGVDPYIADGPADQVGGTDAGSSFVRHASRQVLNDIRASAVMAESPVSGSRARRQGGYRRAEQLPRIDSLERDAVAFAQQHDVTPYSQEARHLFFRQIHDQVAAAGGETAALAIIDLVHALFDYSAGDRRLPEAARILLWRLQMPAVTLASLDAGYLGDDSRSLRRLVEQLAAIAIAYPEEMRPNRPLYQRLQTVVRAVEIVAHAFHIRSQVLSEQVQNEYKRATRGMKQLLANMARTRQDMQAEVRRQPNRRDYSRRPSRMREATLSEDIRRLLDHRLGDSRVPESVSVFLQDVWLRHLRTTALREGSSSHSYQVALKVVDDLLWTLGKEGADPKARDELIQCIPPMLRMLTAGIEQVGAKAEDYSAFFDEIFLIHLRRLQGHGGSAATLIARETGSANTAVPEDDSWSTLVRAAGIEAKPSDARHSASWPTIQAVSDPSRPALGWREPVRRGGAPETTFAGAGESTNDPSMDACSAAAASARLQGIIASTPMDDLSSFPTRLAVPTDNFAEAFRPGQWLELVGRDGRSTFAKAVWLNERRTMVLLLLKQPGQRIMTRQISSLMKRVRQGRLYAVV